MPWLGPNIHVYDPLAGNVAKCLEHHGGHLDHYRTIFHLLWAGAWKLQGCWPHGYAAVRVPAMLELMVASLAACRHPRLVPRGRTPHPRRRTAAQRKAQEAASSAHSTRSGGCECACLCWRSVCVVAPSGTARARAWHTKSHRLRSPGTHLARSAPRSPGHGPQRSASQIVAQLAPIRACAVRRACSAGSGLSPSPG